LRKFVVAGRRYENSMAASNELPRRVRETSVALMRWLRKSRVEGGLVGGVAVSLLAEHRFTDDVDAVVFSKTLLIVARSVSKKSNVSSSLVLRQESDMGSAENVLPWFQSDVEELLYRGSDCCIDQAFGTCSDQLVVFRGDVTVGIVAGLYDDLTASR